MAPASVLLGFRSRLAGALSRCAPALSPLCNPFPPGLPAPGLGHRVTCMRRTGSRPGLETWEWISHKGPRGKCNVTGRMEAQVGCRPGPNGCGTWRPVLPSVGKILTRGVALVPSASGLVRFVLLFLFLRCHTLDTASCATRRIPERLWAMAPLELSCSRCMGEDDARVAPPFPATSRST